MQKDTVPALSCFVPGCRSVRLNGRQRWSAVPVNEARTWVWLADILSDLYQKSSQVTSPQSVHSKHSVSGVSSDDRFNKDYIPTLNLPSFDSDDENVDDGKKEVSETEDFDVSCKSVKVYNSVCEDCLNVILAAITSTTQSECDNYSANYKNIRIYEKTPTKNNENNEFTSNKADRKSSNVTLTKASWNYKFLSKCKNFVTQDVVTLHKNELVIFSSIITRNFNVNNNLKENSMAKQTLNMKEYDEDALRLVHQQSSQMSARCDFSIMEGNECQELVKGIECNINKAFCNEIGKENSSVGNENQNRIIKELEDMVTSHWEEEETVTNNCWEKEREERMRNRWRQEEKPYRFENRFSLFTQVPRINVNPSVGLGLRSAHKGTNMNKSTTNQGTILGSNISSTHQGTNVMGTYNDIGIDHGTSIVRSIAQGANDICVEPNVGKVYHGTKDLHQQPNPLGPQQGLSFMVHSNQDVSPQDGTEWNNITKMGMDTARWNAYKSAADLSSGASDQYLSTRYNTVDNDSELRKGYDYTNKDRLVNNFTFNTLTEKEDSDRDRCMNIGQASRNTGGNKDMALIVGGTNETQDCSLRECVNSKENELIYDKIAEIYNTMAYKDDNSWKTDHTSAKCIYNHQKPNFMDKASHKVNVGKSYDDISSYCGGGSQSELSEDTESKKTNSDDGYEDEDVNYMTADDGSDDDQDDDDGTDSISENNRKVTNSWYNHKREITLPTQCKQNTGTTLLKNCKKYRGMSSHASEKDGKATSLIKHKETEINLQPNCKRTETPSAPQIKKREALASTKSKKNGTSPLTQCKEETTTPTICKEEISMPSKSKKNETSLPSKSKKETSTPSKCQKETSTSTKGKKNETSSSSKYNKETSSPSKCKKGETPTQLQHNMTSNASASICGYRDSTTQTQIKNKATWTQTCPSVTNSTTQTQINNKAIYTQTYTLALDFATQTVNNISKDSTTQTVNKLSKDSTAQTLNISIQDSTTQTVNSSSQDSSTQTVNTTSGSSKQDKLRNDQENRGTPSPLFCSNEEYQLFAATCPTASSNKENVDIVTVASPSSPFLPSNSSNLGACSIHCQEISLWCLECKKWLCVCCLSSHNSSKCMVSPAQDVFAMQKDSIITQASSQISSLKVLKTRLKNLNVRSDRIVSYLENTGGHTINKKDSIQMFMMEVQEWIEKLYEAMVGLTKKKTVDEFETAREKFMKLEAEAEEEKEEYNTIVEKMEAGITGKVQSLIPPGSSSATTTLEVLRGKVHRLECVYAVVKRTNRVAWSRITFEDQYLLLHNFTETPPPVHAKILQFEDVWDMSKSYLPKAFMDVGWYGVKQGRVTYSMLSMSGRCLRFLLLCCGVEGPTYQDTRLLWSPISPNVICGGEYSTYGRVGQGVISIGMNDESPPRLLGLGDVFGATTGDLSRSSVFQVQINHNFCLFSTTSFARVECGLPILSTAYLSQNQATVFNSGIMLKLG
ncbi:hypothetical protein Pmani_040192 [Petrolisthes manimaculis]|uniref:Uncharacterized protein n=1 Tax=Petrolisthes manimaculis TaxID=1843537 RepID=A0AAE1NCR2_9EUCA|nr:hypothetical protein Pmani_040192 [Petrolisthes manimaculis]